MFLNNILSTAIAVSALLGPSSAFKLVKFGVADCYGASGSEHTYSTDQCYDFHRSDHGIILRSLGTRYQRKRSPLNASPRGKLYDLLT